MPNWTRRFDGELRVEPPIADEDIEQIPARRGVALLAGEGGRPILLLTAADIRARVRGRLRDPDPQERSRLPDLHEITRKIFWALCPSPFETDLRFFEIARAVFPDSYTRLLAWKPGWFVHVDPAQTWPHFTRTREVFARGGRHFGPFGTGRSADRFIEAVTDVFDLCRDIQSLRKSPHGQRCSYGQMGRCLCPCDGSVGMDEYRRAVAEAAGFAGGERQAVRQRLGEQMAAAARQLRFELAGRVKRKIDRLAEFDKPDFARVAPAEAFQYLIVQQGPGRRGAKLFPADRGWIDRPRTLEIPLRRRQLLTTLERMRTWSAANEGFGPAERWRMGLVAQYLFRRGPRRGLILPWRAGMTVDALASAIESAADDLRLRPTKPRASGKGKAASHPP